MDKFLDVITALSPIGVAFMPAYMGYLSNKTEKLAKSQYEDLKAMVNDVQSGVDSNKASIGNLIGKVKIHDDSHLNTMYFRLERELEQALSDGYTTSRRFDLIDQMHKNYKALGGNGYIDHLYEQYLTLEIRR